MNKIALIVAGGSGTRMQDNIPKQFMMLNNKPVLMHTLDAFRDYDKHIKIILVLPEDQMEAWSVLCSKFRYHVIHEVRIGGATRFHSVQRNLYDISDDSLVAVHDGVRPLASIKTIERCFETASESGNAVPCIEIPETLRRIDETGTLQVDRTQYRLIQTPQVFRGEILKQAYAREYRTYFTDDAGVVESAGHTICLVEGNPENIKITYKKDLVIAEALMKSVR